MPLLYCSVKFDNTSVKVSWVHVPYPGKVQVQEQASIWGFLLATLRFPPFLAHCPSSCEVHVLSRDLTQLAQVYKFHFES